METRLPCKVHKCPHVIFNIYKFYPYTLYGPIFRYFIQCVNMSDIAYVATINDRTSDPQMITKGCFLSSLVEINPVDLKKRFLIFFSVFSLFHDYLPLGKDVAYHLNKLESPFIRGYFVLNLV